MRDYNIRTAAAVLYDTSTRCTYSSPEPLVPGAAYLVYQAGSTWLKSPVPAARAAVATGAWVESKHMYPIHTNVEVWELKLYFYSQEDKREKRKAYLVPGAVHASTQQTIQIRGTGVCLARKNSL